MIVDMLSERYESAYDYAVDYDPHSALIVRVGDELLLFDPFARVMTVLNNYSNSTSPYTKINRLREALVVQPALETTINLDAYLTTYEWAENMAMAIRLMHQEVLPAKDRWRHALTYSVETNDIQPLLDVLQTISPFGEESFTQFFSASSFTTSKLRKYLSSEEPLIDKADDLIAYIQDISSNIAEDIIRESLAKQIFWLKKYDEDLMKKCLTRCATDERYFVDRVDDLVMWPYRLMLFALQDSWSDTYRSGADHLHVAVELGNLEHRVGSTALLDASYALDRPLPMSFWSRQSSSQLPWLYAAQAEATGYESAVGIEVYGRLRRVLEVMNWRYRQIVGIIYSPERK